MRIVQCGSGITHGMSWTSLCRSGEGGCDEHCVEQKVEDGSIARRLAKHVVSSPAISAYS